MSSSAAYSSAHRTDVERVLGSSYCHYSVLGLANTASEVDVARVHVHVTAPSCNEKGRRVSRQSPILPPKVRV